MRDKVAKGRQARGAMLSARVAKMPRGGSHYARTRPEALARGDGHGQSKLSDAKVRELRALRAEGWSYAALGLRYGVSWVAARNADLRKTWAHVA